MTSRLLLVRHGPTARTRDAVLGDDGPLTERGTGGAATLRRALPRADHASRSPARCAAQTATALGLPDARPEPVLDDWDLGAWRGRTLAQLGVADPGGVRAWIEDPTAAPHGGERLVDLLDRGAAWLAARAAAEVPETHVAITHAALVRACVIAALDAPATAFWSLDVAPLGVTELHRRDGRWCVAHLNREPARRRCR